MEHVSPCSRRNNRSLTYTNAGAYLQLVIAGADKKRGNDVGKSLKEPSTFASFLFSFALVTLKNVRSTKKVEFRVGYHSSMQVALAVRRVTGCWKAVLPEGKFGLCSSCEQPFLF